MAYPGNTSVAFPAIRVLSFSTHPKLPYKVSGLSVSDNASWLSPTPLTEPFLPDNVVTLALGFANQPLFRRRICPGSAALKAPCRPY